MTRPSYSNVYRFIRGIIKRDSGKAILFNVMHPNTGEDLEAWIPTSQINSISYHNDDSGESTVQISEWILRQKGPAWISLPASPTPFQQVPKTSYPKLPSVPPAKSFAEVDDDIPF